MPDKIDTKKLRIVPEDEIVLKSENDAFIKRILETLLAKDKKHDQKLEALSQAFQQLISDLRNQVDGLFVSDRVKKIEDEHSKKIKEIDDLTSYLNEFASSVNKKIAKVKDGYTPKKGKDYFDGNPGKNATLEMVKEALTKPMEEFQQKWEEKVQQALSRRATNLSVGSGRENLLQTIDVSSQINGSTRTFTGIPNARFYPMIFSSQAPFILFPTTHFSIGRRAITLLNNVEIPQSGAGQYLIVAYIR